MRFYSGWSDLQSPLNSSLPLELIQNFFDPPGTALLPILDLLDRIRGGYFPLVCVLLPNETSTSQLRSRRSPIRVGRSGSRGLTTCPACRCVLRVVGLDRRTSSHLQSVPPDPGHVVQTDPGGDVIDGPASSIRCWSGFMKPSEELHVFASSLRPITKDPGRSSPTFPTCWLHCRRVGRLCTAH